MFKQQLEHSLFLFNGGAQFLTTGKHEDSEPLGAYLEIDIRTAFDVELGSFQDIPLNPFLLVVRAREEEIGQFDTHLYVPVDL